MGRVIVRLGLWRRGPGSGSRVRSGPESGSRPRFWRWGPGGGVRVIGLGLACPGCVTGVSHCSSRACGDTV